MQAVRTQSGQYISQANLQLALHLALEATKYGLALGRLETVNDGGDRPNVIRHGEENEFFVYELAVRNLVTVVVEVRSGLSIRSGAKLWLNMVYRRTVKFRSHSLRSSTFFLLNAMSMRARSSLWSLENGIIWVGILLKYSLASLSSEVPKPCNQILVWHL